MRVGIVGAGITGLALTHYLAAADVDVVTFEADAEPGGVVRSGRVNGSIVEYGPQRIRLVPPLEDLVDDLRLQDELMVADDSLPLYIYADGRLREVPRSVSAFARTDLLSWRGKLRILAEPATNAASPDERAAAVFERKFGTEAYRNLFEPLFGGVYGSNPAEMPSEYSLSPLLTLEDRHGSLLRAAVNRLVRRAGSPPPVSFADGLQTLPQALYRKHRSTVRLNSPVDAIRDIDAGGGYILATEHGTTEVDTIVLTVPAPVTATLLSSLDAATTRPLKRLSYNPLVLVHLRADVSAEGFGYQVRRDESLRTLGVTWNSSLFDRNGVYTAFLGSAYDPGIVDLPQDDIAAIARREFQEVMGIDPSVLNVTVLRQALPAYDTSWTALESVDLPKKVILATNYIDRVGVPGRIRQARRIADQLTADR